jgi:LuxR family maltose regulon positive regulatory protein
LRPSLVSRPRIIAKLNTGLSSKLTLVSAPAGSGKTTLLTSWMHQSGRAKAWLSLDATDNELNRFWTYISAALQSTTLGQKVGKAATEALQSTPAPPIYAILTQLINELASGATPVTFVLDDYHLIDRQEIHQSLAFFLDHMPASLHLVIASRTDPPLPLARLRVRGQLSEINTADLRFTATEATVFLRDVMGLSITKDEMLELGNRTEGWIAALQIAALSLKGRTDTSVFIRRFQGGHQHLLDYLAEEVLRQQPPAVQQFLLYTAILDRFNVPLSAAVTETTGTRAILQRLERDNLFLVPLDEVHHWYRYHHLFADFLRSHLQATDPDALPELHRRASGWLAKNGFPEAAINHALAGQDYQGAAQLLREMVARGPQRRISAHVYRWLQELPEEVVGQHPALGLAYAWGACRQGQYETAETWLTTVENQLRQVAKALPPHLPSASETMLGEIETVRAVIACFQGDMATAMSRSRLALDRLPADEHVLRGVLANNMAMNIAGTVGDSGDLSAAGQIYHEAVTAGRASGNTQILAFALTRLGQWQTDQGQLQLAATSFREVLRLKEAAETPFTDTEIGRAHLGLGELGYQWNQLERAVQHLQTGCELIGPGNPLMLPAAYATWAFLLQAQDQPDAAANKMSQAVDMARDSNITWLASNMAAERARLALMQDDLESAVLWADTCGLSVGDEIGINQICEYAMLARVRLAQRRFMEAGDMLDWLLGFVEPLDLSGRVVEVQLLQALVQQALNHQREAVALLTQAVARAAPQGYIRLFLDEDGQLAHLLDQIKVDDSQVGSYLARLRAAFPGGMAAMSSQPAGPLLDPLSDREIEVLRLLVADLTGPEIAAELTVAVSTIRSHMKSIYSKLDVHSRYEAAVRAQELQLL